MGAISGKDRKSEREMHHLKRRHRRNHALALLLVVGLVPACSGGDRDGPEAEPPSILLYVVDTLRPDSLGVYGNEVVSTPHFDRLGAEGVVFEEATANSSWTRASMASLFTGLYPTRHRTRTKFDHLPEGIPTLAEILREEGYETAFINANPNVGGFFGFGRGFRDLAQLYERSKSGMVGSNELIATADEITSVATDWISNTRGPFFLAILAVDPHAPYRPPAKYDRYGGDYRGSVRGEFSSMARADLTPADRARVRSLYDAEVSFIDAAFGRLIEYLRDQGRLGETIVILTADHGEEFWEYERRGHGRSLADPVIRVPLILRFPADPRVEGGTRSERPVELVDVLPTLLDLLDLEAPKRMDGASLLRPRPPGDVSFSELSLPGFKLRAVRDRSWKLVADLRTGESQLYSLGPPLAETEPIDITTSPDAAAAQKRLASALGRVLREAEPSTKSPDDSPEPLPPAVEEALRELGYVE
jgi:arylsulfatase A-like enzyme